MLKGILDFSVRVSSREAYVSYAEASSTYAKCVKDLGAGNVFPGAIAAGTNGRNRSDQRRQRHLMSAASFLFRQAVPGVA